MARQSSTGKAKAHHIRTPHPHKAAKPKHGSLRTHTAHHPRSGGMRTFVVHGHETKAGRGKARY